ncbi:hypothetical protein ACIHAX_36870 [Nocardia sp. NPDC051929]|uniref:hypothetical protein n=1 Tax=unclassified Nocardia TaxID=2637762 RepID=UPI00343711F1
MSRHTDLTKFDQWLDRLPNHLCEDVVDQLFFHELATFAAAVAIEQAIVAENLEKDPTRVYINSRSNYCAIGR